MGRCYVLGLFFFCIHGALFNVLSRSAVLFFVWESLDEILLQSVIIQRIFNFSMMYGLLIYLYIFVYSCITYILGTCVVRIFIGVLFRIYASSFMRNRAIHYFTV
jgi:hypothetical protein